ncbi:heparan-alpha-glucosaminide N-acetyltransferase-like [Cucumis melo var. makuwa]|uniref:Heparan-alpha-glucosaminide N-acetyltransferase-like n=1 Tax=Cucumis melo var. makuwa TaxID=1194695 RepID=A0A5A7T380_CUCMM|nr:heparan-alpha-glucosaminide N-acetyltransferase-like [Cucumis melo var. makuwa]TYK30298.1 heparan-alpha-glucosaminide N-acetyltransferase-like [Cucumis melo var. makuwa]
MGSNGFWLLYYWHYPSFHKWFYPMTFLQSSILYNKESQNLIDFKFEIAAIPINKQLYSFSYVCFIAEAAGIVFSDRRLGFFKAILISRMDWNKCNVGVCNGSSGNFATFINGWYYKDPENSLNDVAACCNWYWIIFSLKINDWENNQIATSTIMTIF